MSAQTSDRIGTERPRRRRGWFGLIAGVVVVLAVAWAGYWYGANWLAAATLDRAARETVAGHRITCTGRDLGGFPLHIDLACDRLTYTDAGEAVTAALAGVKASAPLYRPGHVTAAPIGPLVVNVPADGIALTADWSAASAAASAWIGGLTGVAARFDSLVVENDGNARVIPVERATAKIAAATVAPAGGGSFRFTGEAVDLDVTPAVGNALPTIDGDADIVTEDVGGALGTDPVVKLRAWLRDGGTVRIDRLRVAMSGAEVVAEGSLSLSPQGLLNGSVLLSYRELEALADFIEELRPGSRDNFELAVQALAAMSKPVTIDGKDFRQTPLTFTDGVIWLAIFPLPIDPIPPIRF